MKKYFALLLPLLLIGCASNPNGRAGTYQCGDQEVTLRYCGKGNTAYVTVNGKTHKMRETSSKYDSRFANEKEGSELWFTDNATYIVTEYQAYPQCSFIK